MHRLSSALAVTAIALSVMSAPAISLAANDLKPVRGGTIVASTDVEPATMDPGFGNAPSTDVRTYRLVYENLFVQGQDGKLVPQLATDWTFSEDGMTMIFHIRKGVKFHDGTPLDAAAVAYNLNRMVDPKVAARNGSYLADLKNAEVVDDYTVKLTLKQPSSIVVSSLANETGMIASPTAIEKWGKDFGRNPVGTGPFKFEKWVSGDHIKFSRFDGYWGTDKNGEKLPYLDHAEVRIIIDATSKVIAAEAGTVHMVDSVQPRDYKRIESNPNLDLVPGPVTTYNLLSFNLTQPPFKDNLKLRQAFTTAIDRDSMLQAIYPGTGITMQGIFPPYAQEYNPNLRDYKYDPERAAELYKESGYSGPPITMTMIQRDPDTTIAQILQAQLQEAGIPIKLEVLERLSWTDKVYGHRYQVALHRLGGPRANTDIPNRLGRGGGANHTGQTDLFDIVDKIRSTLDDKKRNAYYGELQQKIVDQAYQMAMVGQREHWIVSKKVKGLQRELNGAWSLTAAWLQQ